MARTKTSTPRRALALCMSVLMLMTAWVFVAPTASAAVTQQSDLPTFTFYVPETIYLDPADNKTFQYYVDRAQSVNGSLTASNGDTSAWYYFKCDTATAVTSLTCGCASPSLSKTSSTNGELKGIISGGALSSAINMNATALVPWTVTFTTDKGTFTATAYSVAYAPNRNVTANGATGYSGNNYNKAYASGLIYIQGAQTTAASTMSSIDSFHSADSYNYQNIDGRMLDPLVNGVSVPDDNQPAGYSRSSSPFTNATNSFASCNCVASEDYGNNDDWTGHIVCNRTPAEVIIDTSRYSNTSQLPNLKLGYIVTDYENTNARRHSYVSNCTSKVSNPNNLSSATFVVDSTDILKHSYWRSDSKMKKIYGSDQNTYGTVLWESSGNSVPQLGGDAPGSNIDGSTDDVGKKYLAPISIAVSGSGTTTINYFRGCASGLYKSSYAISCAMVLLKVTTVTKADLRTLINNCVGTYINPYYTGSRWNTYNTALQNAYTVLGNPKATQSEINTAKTDLQNAANNLKFAIPLTLDQDSTAPLAAGGEVWFSYTPSSTKNYVFFTHADYDTQYELYVDAADSSERDQDDGDYYIRQMLGLGYQVYDEMTLNAGTVYYFKIDAYSSSSSGDTPVRVATPVKVTFNATGGTSKEYNLPKGYDTLKLDKTNVSRTGHTLVGWSTSGTGEESLYKLASATITVPTSAKTYYALWHPNNPTELTLDSTNTVSINTASEIQYFAYTPEKTRDYLIYSISTNVIEGSSNSNPDPYVLIYESDTYRTNGTNIGADDDGGNNNHDFVGTYNRNFFIRTELTAGTTYLIGAKAYHDSTDNNGNVPTGTYELHFEGVYKIDYDANGGENAPTVEHEKFYNRSITLSEDEPTRDHYHFLGWATTDDATEPEYQPGDTCSINDDATLYAVWEIDQYDVTLNTAEDGGYTVSTNPAAKVNHGDSVTFSITLDEGYTDSAAPTCTATNAGTVTSSKDGDVITYTVPNVTGNTTITLGDADINTYTIVWKNWDGTELETDENVPYGATPSYDGEAPTREDDAQYHYTTYSWDPMVGVVTGNKTYTAQFSWEIKSYTVTFKDQNGDVIGFPQEVSYGEDATPPDDLDDYSDANSHYTFDGWSGYTNIQQDTTIQATFTSTAHTFDQEVATADYKASDADCTNAATYYYSCTCGYKGTETFTSGDPLGHAMTPHDAVSGTDCEHYGTIAYYHCSVCEKDFDDEVGTNELTDLSDHTFGAHQLGALTPAVPASNCQTTGTVAYYTCGVCGTLFAADGTTVLTSTDDGTPGSHAFNVLQYDGTYHWYKCANCDATNGNAAHSGGTASCTAQAKCEVCQQPYGDLAAHDFSVLQKDSAYHWYKCANCTAIDGKTAHSGGTASCTAQANCEVCGQAYGDLAAHDFSVLQKDSAYHWYKCANCTAIDGKTAHSGGTATCVKGKLCEICGEEYTAVDSTNHDFSEFVRTVAPTCTEDGYDIYKCSRCEATTHKNSVDALQHDWQFVSFVWAEDNKTAKVNLVCNNDETHTDLVDAEMSSAFTAATCTEDAYTTYTATYGTHTDNREVTDEGTATDHDWQFVSFVWAEDNKTAKVNLVCGNNESHTDQIDAEMTSAFTPATCTEDAYTTYTATYGTHTDSRRVTDEDTATDHDWQFASFTWAEDNKTAKVNLVCGNNESHTDQIDAEMTSAFTAATCTKDAFTVYKATYGDRTESQTVTNVGTATGHAYAFQSFVWSEDGASAQAKLVCANDESHVSYEDATVTSAFTAATCTEDAFTVYTASYDGHTENNTVTNENSKLNHNYQFDSFVWAENGETAQAKLVCTNDESHVSYEDATVTSASTGATCGAGAYTIFTASYDGHTEEKRVDGVGALGHDFGDWELTTEPTCADAGEESRTCARCGATETRPVDALGHDFGDWELTTEPTCADVGEESRTCDRCGATETRPVNALDHDLAFVKGTATCEHAGTASYYECSRCHKKYLDENGTNEVTDSETLVVDKLPHDYSGPIRNDNDHTYHSFMCVNGCGMYSNAQRHVFDQETVGRTYLRSQATCDEPATYYKSCICGEKGSGTFTVGEPLGHDLADVAAVAPTCTKDGHNAYKACSRCSYTENYEFLPATGHGSYAFDSAKSGQSQDGTLKWEAYSCANGCGDYYLKLTVVALDANGNPISGANVKITDNSGKVNVSGTTEANGAFTPGETFKQGVYSFAVSSNGVTQTAKITLMGGAVSGSIGRVGVAPSGSGSGSDSGSSGKVCKYCGQVHTGPFGWLIQLFHTILSIFKR